MNFKIRTQLQTLSQTPDITKQNAFTLATAFAVVENIIKLELDKDAKCKAAKRKLYTLNEYATLDVDYVLDIVKKLCLIKENLYTIPSFFFTSKDTDVDSLFHIEEQIGELRRDANKNADYFKRVMKLSIEALKEETGQVTEGESNENATETA